MKARMLLIYSKIDLASDLVSLSNAFVLVTELLYDNEHNDTVEPTFDSPDDSLGHAMKLDEHLMHAYRLLSQFIDEKCDRPKVMELR